jgi:hypothetical protein
MAVINSKSIDKMRRVLQTRLDQLEENQTDRVADGDEDGKFLEWQETAAKRWLMDNKENGRNMKEETVSLFISSAMRDRSIWPNSGQFKVSLQKAVDNVIRAELVQGSIPLTDPSVHRDNNTVRYSFAPHTGAAIKAVVVPPGAYQGKELALELQTQLNLDLHAGLVTGGSNTMDFEQGYLVDGTGALEATIDQFKVAFSRANHTFTVQLVDELEQPVATPVFALHVQVPQVQSGIARERTDDLYEVLGFNRDNWIAEGILDNGSQTSYILNSTVSAAFGPAADVDARIAHSLNSDQAADLRGNLAVIIDIAPLNDNDILRLDDAGAGEVRVNDYFGVVYTRDPAFVSDRISEFTTNSFPVRKYYHDGRSRIKDLWVTMRRPDGSIINFGNIDFFLTLRLTVSRVQADKPMFAR